MNEPFLDVVHGDFKWSYNEHIFCEMRRIALFWSSSQPCIHFHNSVCYVGIFMSSNDVTDTKAFNIAVTNSTSMHIALSLHFMDEYYAAN